MIVAMTIVVVVRMEEEILL